MPPSQSLHGAGDVTPELAALLARRETDCRLTPDRALDTLDDAEAFVAERGMLTLTPDCALPSLFGACHEEPYRAGGHGFASWPKTRYWWGFALSQRADIHVARLHRGKSLYLSTPTVAAFDPLCRAALARADEGAVGATAAELVAYLEVAGPTPIEDVKRELGLDAASLRATRDKLERVGAIVSRGMTLPVSQGGERETSELARWDQRFPSPLASSASSAADALGEAVVAGIRAAVVAPRAEVAAWFSWPLPRDLLASLLVADRLWQPQEGWLAAREE
ncbi:MAG TPA: hypothetical protein VHI51_17990 [Ktedonobacterales bacterium]|nr:hypothetical protein [Ktedonobacterales bacterium]